MTQLPSLVGDDAIAAMCGIARDTPPGAFAELGVYKGGTAWHLLTLAREQGRSLHLFDTFNGIPEMTTDLDNHAIGDFGDVDLEAVRVALPGAFLYVGMFPYSWPVDGVGPLAFVHIDCDQYRTCQHAIAQFWPDVVPGGAMLFDDYDCTRGVTRAVDEAFGSRIQKTAQSKAWVRKT